MRRSSIAQKPSLRTHLCRRDDLPSTALALRGTLDDTGQIQHLDFRAAVFEHAGYGREGGEGVRRDFTLGLGDLGQERGFADGREADERDTRVAALADVEAGAAAGAGAWAGLEKLCS